MWSLKGSFRDKTLVFLCKYLLSDKLSLSLCQILTLVAMVPAIIKLYFIGTVFSVLAVLYSVVDSFGALAHVQDHSYMWDLEEMKAGKKIPPAPTQEAPQWPNTWTPEENCVLSLLCGS